MQSLGHVTGTVMASFGLAAVFACTAAAQGHILAGVTDEAATIENKLGEPAALDTRFRDELGEAVVLQDLVSGELPIVLNFGYYSCPGLCSFVLNGLLESLRNGGMVPGDDFELLTISIDHREKSKLARDKKAAYIRALERPSAAPGWHFLTGDEDQIERLTDSVGWRFQWWPAQNEYNHPPMIVLLSKDGTVTRYLDATTMSPVTFRRAIVEAGDGQVGSFLERVLVSCLTFDANSGAYTVAVMTVLQIGGVLTLLALGVMFYRLWRRERSLPPVVMEASAR